MTRISGIMIVIALLAVPCLAQFDTAEVLGTIRDNSDAVIPGATVTLLNVDTGIQATAVSDENGNYTFPNVKVGKYSVSAEMAGFAKAVASGVTVTINARQRVDLKLQVGSLSTTVEVTGAAAVLQMDTSERGQLINTVQVVELPLNGRNYSDLALLTTGVTQTPNSPGGSSGRPREGSFAVNGLRSVFSNYLLDGVDNNAYGTSNRGASNQVMQSSPDTVAEFRVITNNYSAEYGRSGGATINVVTKSGTNTIHGNAYDFVRNTNLNAVGYIFGPKPSTWRKPTLQQNQFGMSLGGPIIKNKAFFFVDYEAVRSIAKDLSFASIPTLDDRKGIFPMAVQNPVTGKVYPANSGIPESDMQYFARVALGQFPTPNGPGRSSNYQQLLRNQTYSDKYDAKIDAQINEKMSTFARWSQRKEVKKNQGRDGAVFGGSRQPTLNQQLVLGYTWTIGSGSVVEGRFGLSRVKASSADTLMGRPLSAWDEYRIPGLPEDPEIRGGLPNSVMTGFTAIGRGTAAPQIQDPTTYDPKINYARTIGRHLIKVGYEFVRVKERVLDINPAHGKDSYLGQFSKVPGGPADANSLATYSLADFMFGLRSQYVLSPLNIVWVQKQFHYAYFQDDFRPTSNLTLNLGLRWEYGSPWVDPNDKMANFDPATNSLILSKPGGSTAERALVNPDYKNFAPRFGFAYTLNPKTVIRGGYGISHIHEHRVGSAEELNIFGPDGIVATIDQKDPLDPGFLNTQQGYPAEIIDPSRFDPLKANVTYIPKDVKTSYVQAWVLDIQRELTKNFVLDFAYVGNRGLHLPIFADYNQAYPQPTPTSTLTLQQRRPIQNFGAITWWNDSTWSTYHGFQAKVERRFASGLSFINSFTWSKSIDTAVQSLDTSNGNMSSPQDVRNMASEKGLGNNDMKFVNVTSFIYQLPFGRGRQFLSSASPLVDHILGGWQFTAINNLLSGVPINLRAWNGTVPALFQTVGNLNDWRGGEAFRPNVIGPVVNTDSGVDITENYFNKGSVALPKDPSQPFGNAGRNSVRQTGRFTLDLGIYKDFPVSFREDMKVQFRAEFFNATNHTNFIGANSDVASVNFGKIRGTYPQRQIQIALKFIF